MEPISTLVELESDLRPIIESIVPGYSARARFRPHLNLEWGDAGSEIAVTLAALTRTDAARIANKIATTWAGSRGCQLRADREFLNATFSDHPGFLFNPEPLRRIDQRQTIAVIGGRDQFESLRALASACIQVEILRTITGSAIKFAVLTTDGWSVRPPVDVAASGSELIQTVRSLACCSSGSEFERALFELQSQSSGTSTVIWIPDQLLGRNDLVRALQGARSRDESLSIKSLPASGQPTGQLLEGWVETCRKVRCGTVALYLCSGQGEDLDPAVPLLGEAANLPWFVQSLRDRLTEISPDNEGLTAPPCSIEIPPEWRELLVRTRFVRTFWAAAGEDGAVSEWVVALAKMLQRALQFSNRPELRLAIEQGRLSVLERHILSGLVDGLSGIIDQSRIFDHSYEHL